jgi:ABC-type amino acid transport substrate-binding protein
MLLGLMLVLSINTEASAVQDNILKQLVPTGKLRVGVAYAPAPTPIFVAKDAAGDVHGVPLDLGNALAKTLDVPVETGRLLDRIRLLGVCGDICFGGPKNPQSVMRPGCLLSQAALGS